MESGLRTYSPVRKQGTCHIVFDKPVLQERIKTMLYPIMTASRELIDLNGIWKFKLDHGSGFAEEWFCLLYTSPSPRDS